MEGLTASILGCVGLMEARRSAEPDKEVDDLFPCFPMNRRDEANMLEGVEMLNVLWESPPVPTMSHCAVLLDGIRFKDVRWYHVSRFLRSIPNRHYIHLPSCRAP